MITGHSLVQAALSYPLPPVTLLLGPESVGKRTLAEHAARHHGVKPCDIIRIDKLDAPTARNVLRYAATWPQGPFKMIILRLDGASDHSLNILLKVLEEPPDSIRFILLATEPPIPTIMSRSRVCRCGLLTDAEVERVLRESGMDPVVAARLAPHGHGHVRRAMEADATGQAKGIVLSALKAVALRDTDLLDRAMRRWTDEAHEALMQWAYEASSGIWRMFTKAESFGMADPEFARKLLRAVSQSWGARPRLAAMNVLEAACQRR